MDIVIAWSEDDAIVNGDQRVPGRLREIDMHTRDALKFKSMKVLFVRKGRIEWTNLYEVHVVKYSLESSDLEKSNENNFSILSIRLSIRSEVSCVKIYKENPCSFDANRLQPYQ